MKKISAIVQHLSSQGYLLSPVRLTLCNYLSSLFEPDDLFTEDVIHSFIQDSLDYPHWQQHRDELVKTVFSVVKETGEDSLIDIQHLETFANSQIVEIASDRDHADVVQAYLTHQMKGEYRQFRIFLDGKKKVCAICLLSNSYLRVYQFDRKFAIRNGQLVPLRNDLCLQFNSSLELDSNFNQKIEIGPYLLARFRPQSDNSIITGKVVRGYIFQKFQEFNGVSIETFPRLFLGVKRLEQFFIRRETDPYYQRLLQDLERTIQWVKIGEPLDPGQVSDLQVQVQNALEYVYTPDRVLGLLLKDLQNSLIEHPVVPISKQNIVKIEEDLYRGTENQSQANWDREKLPLWNKENPKAKFASINSLRNVGFVPDDTPTKQSKKVASPSTEKKSSSLELKSILKAIKFSSMANR